MTPRCVDCGRFCMPYDEYTDFGRPGDTEPPDPVLLCEKCSEELEERLVWETMRPKRFYVGWRPAKAHVRAAKRLGMVFAGAPIAAWCEVFWPEQVPKKWIRWTMQVEAEKAE